MRFGCPGCRGTGLRPLRARLNGETLVCGCILKHFFRRCYARFRRCVTHPRSRASKTYAVDFALLAKRVLIGADRDLFRFYFLLDLNVASCARRLKITERDVRLRLDLMEEDLGAVYCTVPPKAIQRKIRQEGAIRSR